MTSSTTRLHLIEAAKVPNPEKFVPVFDWNMKAVWVWVKQPGGGKVVGPVEIAHGNVSAYAGKLGWLPQKTEYVGMLDPSTYEGYQDIYPATWKPGGSLAPNQHLGDAIVAKFKPPKMPKGKAASTAGAPSLPPNVKLMGSKDPNGLPEAEDTGSGEEFSVLPNGKFAQWDEDDGFYYAVEPDEDGDYVVQLSPKWTVDQVKALGEPKPEPKTVLPKDPTEIAKEVAAKVAVKKSKKTEPAPTPGKHLPEMDPPEGFELPPNYSIEKVTPSHVVAVTPDGTKVKWIKVTDHWVHADAPHKDHEPLQAAPEPKKPSKSSSIKATEKAVKAAAKKAKETGAAVVTATQVQTKKELAPSHEPAPASTKYTGEVDVNGLPMVDEVPDDDDYEATDVSTGLTLLPDDRVARWKASYGYYRIYDYDPYYGFMYSKSGATITLDEVKQQMEALRLTVQNARYHSYTVSGTEKAQPSTYETPLPPHCKKLPKKDKNGLQMVETIPSDEFDDPLQLSLLPDGRLAKWREVHNRYIVHIWRDILGDYNYYPTHPAEYVTLKEIKKLQAQVPSSPVSAPTKKPPKPKKVAPPTLSPEVAGVLTPTGEKDPKGYPIGDYKGNTYSMLPDSKVGIWSTSNGAYILYAFDSLGQSYYNTGKTWTPPSTHTSLANFYQDNIPMPQVADSDGNEAVVLPNGKFAEYSTLDGNWKILKVDVTGGKKFVPTGEEVEETDVKPHFTAAYKSLKPMGEVDENGLPTFQQKTLTIPVLSLLPNGDFGRWMQSYGYYRKYEYDPSDGTWSTSDPPETFTVNDINAMYLKAGSEKFKDETAKKPDNITGHDSLKPTGKVDENGHELFQVTYGTAGPTPPDVIKLPNDTIGWGMQVGDELKYLHMMYADEGQWKGTLVPVNKNDPWLTADQVQTILNAALPGIPTKAQKATFTYTAWTDHNGYPVVKVTMGNSFGKKMTLLPDGRLGKWASAKKSYRLYAYRESDDTWTYLKPPTWVALADLPPPANAAAEGSKTLSTPGTSDPNGYPHVKVIEGASKGMQFSLLPNGTYAKWRATQGEYLKYEYDPNDTMWGPAHPQVWITLDELETAGGIESEVSEPEGAPKMPAEAAFVTPMGDLPDPNDMKPVQMHLKGAGDKTVLEDPKTGKRYIFKLASQKNYPENVQPFKAKSQEVFADIAALVRPDAHVPVETVKYKGKLGTLQPMLTLNSSQPDLNNVKPEALTEQQKKDVAEEHILDWVMSQHDSFASNFVVTEDGRVVGIDKEQGWKYVNHPKHPDELSTEYKPNTHLYGEQEPYYNKFWRAFASGKMDFDPKEMGDALTRMEQANPATMEAGLNAYADTLTKFQGPKNAHARYAFVKQMMSRKNTVRYDFEKFITEQYKERTKQNGVFTFNAGWQPEGEADKPQFETITQTAREWALKEFGASALKPHKDFASDLVLVRVSESEPVTKVQEFLSKMGVEPATHDPDGNPLPMNPILGSYYNSVIVKVSDLNKTVTRTVEIKKDPGQKFAVHSGVPTYYAQVLAPAASPGNVAGLAKAHQEKLGPLGKDFTLDADAVEQQTASVQRVIDQSGETFYRVHFKLRKPYWETLTDKGTYGTFTWPLGAYEADKDALVLSSYQSGAYSQPARVFKSGDDVMYVMTGDAKFSFMGSVYAIIRSGGSKVKSAVTALLKEADLDKKVMKDPTPAETRLLNMRQALWYLDPEAHKSLKHNSSAKTVEKKLAEHLTPDEIASITQVTGTVSRGSPMLPGLWRKLGGGTPEKPVIRFVFWDVSGTSPAKILRSAATGIHERVRMGLPGGGSGPGTTENEDISTGGADTTTMRISTAKATDQRLSHTGNVHYNRIARVIIAPELLDRLDISLSTGDAFGCQNPKNGSYGHYFKDRRGMGEAIKKFDDGYSHEGTTEIQIRRGVPPNLIKRICCSSESDRRTVLENLEKAGITEHNKVPIEDFVVVEDNAGNVYNKYIKPLGY
jgi:hypothetical protein